MDIIIICFIILHNSSIISHSGLEGRVRYWNFFFFLFECRCILYQRVNYDIIITIPAIAAVNRAFLYLFIFVESVDLFVYRIIWFNWK